MGWTAGDWGIFENPQLMRVNSKRPKDDLNLTYKGSELLDALGDARLSLRFVHLRNDQSWRVRRWPKLTQALWKVILRPTCQPSLDPGQVPVISRQQNVERRGTIDRPFDVVVVGLLRIAKIFAKIVAHLPKLRGFFLLWGWVMYN